MSDLWILVLHMLQTQKDDIGGIITTIDRRTTRSDGRTLITTEGGADVTIERQSDGTFKYINNSNEFELHELADGTYTHNGNSAEITPTEITVASTGEVFDHNGDPKEDSEDSEDDDKCVAPQTTCVIEDPCTSSSSSFGWNQRCVPSTGYKYGFRTGGYRRRRFRFSRCYRYPTYYC